MTNSDHATGTHTTTGTYGESILAALLDALCSPQLYDIVMHEGELTITPRPHMHPQPAH